MAYSTTNAPAAADRARGAIATLFSDWAERYSKWRAYRRTVAELDQLSDRELHDLGLSRAGIYGVAHEAVYG